MIEQKTNKRKTEKQRKNERKHLKQKWEEKKKVRNEERKQRKKWQFTRVSQTLIAVVHGDIFCTTQNYLEGNVNFSIVVYK